MAAFQVTLGVLAHRPTCTLPHESALHLGRHGIPEVLVMQVRKLLHDHREAGIPRHAKQAADPLHLEEQLVLHNASEAWLPVR